MTKITECPGCGVKIVGTLVYECHMCGTFSCEHCGPANGTCKECSCVPDFIGMVDDEPETNKE